ncbi:MAG: hypothetical protein Q7R87_05010 [Nanoarchaeota archaeon]|nr:hypothetical protein [Nanoarchaeota archaeon]
MKLEPFVKKLNSSTEYKDFIGKNPSSYIVAGFFIMDYEDNNSLHQIDYYLPKQKKVAAFTLEPKITMQMMELMNEKAPEKLDLNTKVDLDTLQGIIEDEMKNRGISENIRKIIAILQSIKGKKMWNISCVLSGMSIIKAHVDDESKTVLKMDKSSIMDYVKKMPGAQLGSLADPQNQAHSQTGMSEIPQAQTNPVNQAPQEKISKEQIKEQIDKLNKVEETIELEKQKLSKFLKDDEVKLEKASPAKLVKKDKKKGK